MSTAPGGLGDAETQTEQPVQASASCEKAGPVPARIPEGPEPAASSFGLGGALLKVEE